MSYLSIAALIVGLPIPLALSRLLAARRGRLELGLVRQPLRRNLVFHRLQLFNVLMLCGLLAGTVFTGAYDASALAFSEGAYRAFLAPFVGGLLVLLLVAAVPLKQVRLASNLLALCGSLFIAAQLVMIYRPAVTPVPIASPLADEWLVGQGGHSELVNYHYVTSTQRDALDILQAQGGRTHRPGSTNLASYYIYGKQILAPAAGTVTFVQDGRADQAFGSSDRRYQSGNNIVVDIGGGHFVMMAHLSPGSIQVKIGDHVNVGQPIAKLETLGTRPSRTSISRLKPLVLALGMSPRWTPQLSFVRCTPTHWCSPMLCLPGGIANPSRLMPTRGVAILSGQPTDLRTDPQQLGVSAPVVEDIPPG